MALNKSNGYLKKIDKPLLRPTKRIYNNNLNTELGQPAPVYNVNELRAKFLILDKEIKRQNKMFNIVGWFIVIYFSLMVLIGCICTALPGTNIVNALSVFVSMACLIWIPAFLVIKHKRAFQNAVKNGQIQGYIFKINEKWLHEYYNDTDTILMHLIQFANVYTEADYSYEVIKPGDSITVYIVTYKGKQYFANWYAYLP